MDIYASSCFVVNHGITCWAKWGIRRAITCIMLVSAYICWVRLKNALVRMSIWPGGTPGGKSLGSLNGCQYRINICAKMDASMWGNGGYCFV